MIWYRNLRMLPKIMLPVALMLVLALGVLTWQIQSRSSQAITTVAEKGLAAFAGRYGNQVEAYFERPLNEAKALADSISYALDQKRPLSRQVQLDMIRGTQERNATLLAVGLALEPGAEDSDNIGQPGHDATGRFVPYAAAGDEITPLEDVDASEYYAAPKSRNQGHISRPILYKVGGKDILMTTASYPIQRNGAFQGAVVIDISMERVEQLIEGIKVYNSGWASLISPEGTVIVHRDHKVVNSTILDSALVANRDGLRKAMADKAPFMETHALGGEENFYYYYPISINTTGRTWYLLICAPMDEVLEQAVTISRITMILCLGTLVLAMLLIYLVVRSSVRPLGYLSGVAQEIAKGDLHRPINDETFGGEIKELSTALKDMIASLIQNIDKAEAMSRDAMEQTEKAQEAMKQAEEARRAAERAKRDGMLAAADSLSDIVSIVSSASEQLSAQIEQSEQGAHSQAARVSETATAMEEMNVTVLEVARNAGMASEISSTTREKAEHGASVVNQAVEGILKVQDVSISLKADMTTLAGQAESISQIMSVISDIADQTNLLALNAAIEAARAGDAGRGFAVVADEVRKLAEKTMASTTDVASAINSIQASVRQSLDRMDTAVDLVEKATELSNQSGAELGEIVNLVDSTADQVRSIATASEEQSATSEEINRAISEINSLATESATTMREAATAVADLASQAQSLNRLIEEMKNS